VTTGALAGFHDYGPLTGDFRAAVLAGLARSPKQIPSKFIYDDRGAQLFEAILTVPEYYVPRIEMALLRAHADELAALAGPHAYLVDYGSGSSAKARLLLDSFDRPAVYVPLDIAGVPLLQAAEVLAEDYPAIEVQAVCADYLKRFELPEPRTTDIGKRIGFFPGATIGNMMPEERRQFLARAAAMLSGGGLIVGVDLKKDPQILRAAYNDAQGASAAFNTNILVRLKRELGAIVDVDGFRHWAEYDAEAGRMEIAVESLKPQTVQIDDHIFSFVAREHIVTQYAYKFTVEEFQLIAASAGFRAERVWVDDEQTFSIHYLAAP
jgi:dimethylhistidine N-methyltransferase